MNPKSEPKVLFSKEDIATAVKKLVDEITQDYRDKSPLLVGVLKGSFIFVADLIRLLEFPLEVEFITLSSYGRGKTIPGPLNVMNGLAGSIKGKHVLVVEDIVDTGQSLAFLIDYLNKKQPSSLKVCVLADKPSRRRIPVSIDYTGFTVPDKFIVGYGMDWDEKFRNLPYIGYIELES